MTTTEQERIIVQTPVYYRYEQAAPTGRAGKPFIIL